MSILLLLLFPVVASAYLIGDPLYIVFSVKGDPTDPVNAGVTASGWWHAVGMPDYSYTQPGDGLTFMYWRHPSAFSFEWDGVEWHQDGDGNIASFGYYVTESEGDYWISSWDPFEGIEGDRTLSMGWKAGSHGYSPTPYPQSGTGAFTYSRGFDSYTGIFTWSTTPDDPRIAPEPGTLALFGSGLLALGVIRRRKSGLLGRV